MRFPRDLSTWSFAASTSPTPRERSRCRASTCTSPGARPSPWSAAPAPASRRWLRLSRARWSRRETRCSWAASTSGTWISSSFGVRSGWSRSVRKYSRAPSLRTSLSSPTSRGARSRRRWSSWVWAAGLPVCRTASRPSSVPAALRYRPGRSSSSPSPACWCVMCAWSCSTRPRPAWTRSRSAVWWQQPTDCSRPGPASSSPTGYPRSSGPRGWPSWTAGASFSRASARSSP